MYTQVSSRRAWPPIRSSATNGSSASGRRAKVCCGSNRAQRTAASKSKLTILEAELQTAVDFAANLLERLGELVLERNVCKGESDQVSVGLNARAFFGLFDQGRTDPTGDTAALFLEQTGPFRGLHHSFKAPFTCFELPARGVSLERPLRSGATRRDALLNILTSPLSPDPRH